MEVAVRDGSLYQAGFATALEGARQLGVSSLEVALAKDGAVRSLISEQNWNLHDPAQREEFGGEAAANGLRVCALLCAQNFNAPDPQPEIEYIRDAGLAAIALGIPAVRVDSHMTGQAELPLDVRVAKFVQPLRQILEVTEGSTVAFGIENHGPQGNDPEWMLQVVRGIDNARLGLTLDVGNWYWYGHPLSYLYGHIYPTFAPYTVHTHVKNINYPAEIRETQREIGHEYGKYNCPLAQGDLDLALVARILRDAGYDGDLCIEDESLGKFPLEERARILAEDVEHLRRAIAVGTAPTGDPYPAEGA